MDLVAGVKRVIVIMDHVTRAGEPKLLRKCTLPLTGIGCIDMVITDLAVFQLDRQRGLMLTELAPYITIENVKNKTGASFGTALIKGSEMA